MGNSGIRQKIPGLSPGNRTPLEMANQASQEPNMPELSVERHDIQPVDADKLVRPVSAAVDSGTSGAHRIVRTILQRSSDCFHPVFLLENKTMLGNFFVGYQRGDEEQREVFERKLHASGIFSSDIVDDFITIGRGSGLKIVQLDQMLEHMCRTSKPMVNLNVIISEKAAPPGEDPATVVNTMLALNALADLDEIYRRVLSFTFISNDCLVRQAGERSPNYRDSNELLARHTVLERYFAAAQRLRLTDLIGSQDARFSTVGFASAPPRQDPQDNAMIIRALGRIAIDTVWLTPGNLGIGNDDLRRIMKRARVVAVLPPSLYEDLSQRDYYAITDPKDPTKIPSLQKEKKGGGLRESIERGLMPDKEQRSEYSADSELKIEMIKGPEDEKEICVFSRVVLDCEAVVEGFKAIKQSLEMMKQDAREDKPQTPLGRKYRELYLMAYHESPRL